tara:strand:- start:483 stop:749 length:267 start_codon:yes stop_codon:yes gene_type:complete
MDQRVGSSFQRKERVKKVFAEMPVHDKKPMREKKIMNAPCHAQGPWSYVAGVNSSSQRMVSRPQAPPTAKVRFTMEVAAAIITVTIPG